MPPESGNLRTEILAGITTFLTMSYIVIVNPAILSDGTGLSFPALVTATVLSSALPTILMGLVAGLPYALAPGMGLNAFFSYGMVQGSGMTPEQALGAVVVSGLFFTVLSATPARTAVARAVPPGIRAAAAAGIGLFLALIGLKNGGVVVGHPVTLVAPGPLTVEVGLFVVGLLLIALLLHWRVRGALLAGIGAVTVAALLLGRVDAPARWFAPPDFSLVGRFDLGGIWTVGLVAPLITLIVTDLFDSLSTFLGVANAANLLDERGEPIRMGRALTVDSLATLFAGLLGSSPSTTYVESAAGIREGGRSGVTAVVAGLCFLPLLFVAPVAAMVPSYATAPVLVVVGFFMLHSLGGLVDAEPLDAIPALLTLILMPLTFSITQGLVWGVLAHLVLYTATGRARSISLALWLVGLACAAVLAANALAR